MKKWEYTGDYLENFDKSYIGAIGNLYCVAYRKGCHKVDDVLEYVYRHAEDRTIGAYSEGNYLNYSVLKEVVYSDASREFAEHIIWRESLSDHEKRRLKAEAQKQSVSKYMDSQPPSEKQLSFLKSLGCTAEPQTKLEASKLIEEFLKKRAA